MQLYVLLALLSLNTLAIAGSNDSIPYIEHLYHNSFGTTGKNATYDYIVVGGGTAGNTIAARLAENPAISIAVIEAGGFYQVADGNLSVVPGYTFLGTGSSIADGIPSVDWSLVTTPQAGANGRRMHYARGKTLGGSSARNYMAYHRPTVDSLKMWANQVGDESYTFENLLPYYEKSVSFTAPDFSKRYTNSTLDYDRTVFDNALDGPLAVSYANYASPTGSWFQLALEKAGVPLAKLGFNSGALFGNMWSTSTIYPGSAQRCSSQTSFLDQAVATSTLKVYNGTMARRLLFKNHNVAGGVLVTTNGEDYVLSARKEVIISAGAFQSPQLLMVSGVGPKDTLQEHGIPLVSELSGVGQNMWDHVLFSISYRVKTITSSRLIDDPQYAAQAILDYNYNQTGPLTGFGYLAFEKIPKQYRGRFSSATEIALDQFLADWPEMEYLSGDAYTGYNTNYMTADPQDGYQYASIDGALVAPLSRGNVTINSKDTMDPPLINPNWLTAEADIEVAIAGFKRTRQVWANMHNITIGEEYLPGPNVTTDEDILAFIRQDAIELYHASATCAMGKKGDPMAVVDSQARVFGVQGLRVVDASAFPFLPPGHPQSTVYALAEKIADDIKRGR